MNYQNRTSAFWTIFALSLSVYLLTFWTSLYHDASDIWVYTVCYFALTWYCLQRFNRSVLFSASAMILGRIMLEIPLRIYDYIGTYGTMMLPVASVISIVLGCLCFKERKTYVFVFSIIIMIVLNIFVRDAWHDLWLMNHAMK